MSKSNLNYYLNNSTFLPGVKPGESRSTIKPVNALLAGALGSGFVRAKTKYLYKQKRKHAN